MVDVLTQVFEMLRIQTAIFAMRDLPSPWGVEFPAGTGAYFHVIGGGGAWLDVEGEPARRLDPGDTVFLAYGTGHWLTDRRDGSVLVRFDSQTWRPNELVSMGNSTAEGAVAADGSGNTLICGTVDVREGPSQPLLALLPKIIVVGRDDSGADDLELTVRLLRRETRGAAPGSHTMLARLGDVLLLQMVRRWLEDQDADHLNWLGALRDPRIGAALSAMHADPGANWTVESLAEQAHLSRSRFAEQFTARVGQAPMTYLTNWRLTLARHLLGGGGTIRAVSRSVGYSSEPAFSRAFTRYHGTPPSRTRDGP